MKDHSVADFYRLQMLSGVTLSPDSAYLAFVSSNTYREIKGIIENKIVLKKLSDGTEKVVSEDHRSSSSPSFSPDSSRLAFTSSDKDSHYIVIVDTATGNCESSSVHGKPSIVRWKDNDTMIALIEDYHEDEKVREKDGNDGFFFEENHKFQSLWEYTPGRGMKRITSGYQIWDFSLNGNKAVAIVSELPYDWSWYEATIAAIDLGNGKAKTIYTPEKRQLSSPTLSGDGSRVYFIESLMSDNGVESGDILVCDYDGSNVSNLTANQEKTFTCLSESSDGQIYVLANNMGTFEIQTVGGDKVVWSSYGTVVPVFSPKFSHESDRFAFAFTSKNQRQEVFLLDMNGKATQVTKINEPLSDLRSYDSESVTWKSKDGLEIYGLYRHARDGAPLVVVVHGGPTSSSVESFIDLSTLLQSSGYSVFLPNYRGSTGKGRKYAELNRGDMGGMDFTDIMEGLDYILENKKVDRNRVYITGGSYGGFMSAWAVTQTDRFTASVSLFGISDWISFHGVSSLAVWDSIHYDQDPYLFDRFVKFSAMRHLDNVKTPILLMHGIEDPYVPVGQYHQLYRALKEKGKETRLLLFPREGHGFREKKHFEMYIDEMVKWFRDHS